MVLLCWAVDTFRWLFEADWQWVWSPAAWQEKILTASFHNHVKTAATPEALLSWASYARTLTMWALAELIGDAWVENRGGPSNAPIACLAGEADKERNTSGEGVGASQGQATSGNFKLPQRGSSTAQNNGQNLGQYAWMHSDLEASVFLFKDNCWKKNRNGGVSFLLIFWKKNGSMPLFYFKLNPAFSLWRSSND